MDHDTFYTLKWKDLFMHDGELFKVIYSPASDDLHNNDSSRITAARYRDRRGTIFSPADADGMTFCPPILAYHGSSATFDQFHLFYADVGFHFGTKAAALERMIQNGVSGDEQYLLTCQLRIGNPYDIVSDLGDWRDHHMLREYFGEACAGPLADEFNKRSICCARDVALALRKRGYDGVTYRNGWEDKGSMSYVAFDPDQIDIISREPVSKYNHELEGAMV